MTTTTALLLNAVLAVAVVAAFAGVVRLALRLRPTEGPETLHPSQPIPLAVIAAGGEDRGLAHAA